MTRAHSTLIALGLLFGSHAYAQGGAIQQSGTVTAFHPAVWFQNGVVGDAGPFPKFLNVVNLTDQGAKCDGVTDDTAAIRTWLAKAAPQTELSAPPGICVFTGALTVPSGGLNGVGIVGAGPYQTIFKYVGASTTIDLLTIGDGSSSYANWYLSGFEITSTTVMTAGTGMHLRGFQRSSINNVIWDGQDGTGDLWNGVWFDGVDFVTVDVYQARGQNDAVRVDGVVGVGQADLLLNHGKIASSGVGLHIGGGFGGVFCDTTDVIANGQNVVIDNALVAVANREIFLEDGCTIDTATVGDAIYVNDTLAGAQTLYIGGWVATGVASGINIVQDNGAKISIASPVIWHFSGDGVKVQDSTAIVAIGAHTLIHNNVGFGINATVSTFGITSPLAPFANTAGSYSADANLENRTATAGYTRFPNGLVHEWGTATFTGAANTILTPVGGNPVSLPLSCPTAIITSTLRSQPFGFPNGAQQLTTSITPISTTGVNLSLVASATVTVAQTVNFDLWCY